MDYLRTLDDILSNLPQGILVRCRDEILYANRAAAAAFGFGSARDLTDYRAVTGLMGTFVRPQKDPERRFSYFSTVDGDLFFADVTERSINFRGQQAVQITFNSPLHAADDMADSRTIVERYALAMRHAKIGVWDHDREAGSHFFSSSCREILGLPETDARTYLSVFEDLIYPEDRPLVRAACAKAFGERIPYQAQFRIMRPTGEVRWVSVSGTSIHDRDGLVLRFAGTVVDISDQKQKERELIEARKTALAGLEAKNRFVSGLSHEFRTPIHALMALPRILKEQSNRPELTDLVEASELAGEQLLSLVDSALDLSGIDSGTMDIRTNAFPLAKTCLTACDAMQARTLARGIDLQLDIDPAAQANFLGDEKLFLRTLQAMLRHAIERSGPGIMKMRLSAGENGHGTLVILQDVGAPYSSHEARSLFEPFSSIQTPDNPITQSNGIDLPLARKLARAMGGDVTIATRGTRNGAIQFYLPLERVASNLDEPIGAVGHMRTLCILVVEDNLINQRIIAVILEQLGHSCVIVADGVMCLETIQKARFDAILMDLHMPNMDGYQTTRHIRALEADMQVVDFPAMPIIALTADARPETREAAFAAGMTGFLNKPISIPELYEALAPIAAAAAEEPTAQNG
jgi:PAS domain S-box-containing protein